MHPTTVEQVVQHCKSRVAMDSVPPLSAGTLEDCIVVLAQQRDDASKWALTTLATAFQKFAPDLAKELALRWEKVRKEEQEALARLIAMLGPYEG